MGKLLIFTQISTLNKQKQKIQAALYRRRPSKIAQCSFWRDKKGETTKPFIQSFFPKPPPPHHFFLFGNNNPPPPPVANDLYPSVTPLCVFFLTPTSNRRISDRKKQKPVVLFLPTSCREKGK